MKIIILLIVSFYSSPVYSGNIAWPPVLGMPYPDLALTDSANNTFLLSQFRGKIILVEHAATSCAACVAFAGGHQKGAYKKVRPQAGLDAFELMFYSFAPNADMSHDDFVFIQIFHYDEKMQNPSVKELQEWRNHFALNDKTYVTRASDDFHGKISRAIIPGFQLIDRDFVLKADATGSSQSKLYTELLPMLGELLTIPQETL